MMATKVGITRFFGTNCDEDIRKWLEVKNYQPVYLWQDDLFDVSEYDFIIVPGGFSYGDYLRCGALAARTQVMKSVIEFAKAGKPILGVCNGFQILCEAGLLPGVLTRNKELRFIDQFVDLKVENSENYFSKKLSTQQRIRLPMAHGEGNYFNNSDDLKRIVDNNQIWLTYCDNPNGAALNIAGLTNKNRNVCGLMPHPERALFDWMGSSDGDLFL